jgi:hypothetical protein
MLAGLTRREEPQAHDLFAAVLDELTPSPEIPSDEVTALWLLARETAARIINGTVQPLNGADLIWRDFAEPLDYPPALMPFINAIVAANADPPAPVEQLNADILRTAQALLTEPPPNP